MHPEEVKYYYSIALAVGLLTIIVFTFIISTIINQRKIIKLHDQLIKAEIDILEKERKRLAEDLHDDMGPILSTIKLYLGMLQAPADDDKTILNKVSGLLDNAIAEIRVISQNLLPVALQNRGLHEAVYELVEQINASRSKHIYIDSKIPGLKLHSATEIAVFRIIHELLNNIIKHSKATEVHIGLHKENDTLKLQIKDNGIGFDYATMQSVKSDNKGLGLKSIANRVNMLQGKVSFNSESGKGTEVRIDIPVK
jgi:signal transduction histidine kinase